MLHRSVLKMRPRQPRRVSRFRDRRRDDRCKVAKRHLMRQAKDLVARHFMQGG